MHPFPLLLTAALQASQPTSTQSAAGQPASDGPEITVTCRTQRATGTRVVRKVCRTVEQQRQDDREARIKLRMGTQVQATEVFKRPKGD